MCEPGCAKGGSVAVTMTAAVFFTVMAAGIHGDAHVLQHVGQTLGGEDGLLPVAGAVQADDQAVADELVVAHAFERDQFLETRGGGRGWRRDAQADQKGERVRFS